MHSVGINNWVITFQACLFLVHLTFIVHFSTRLFDDDAKFRTYNMQLLHILSIRGSPSTVEWPEFHDAKINFTMTHPKNLDTLNLKYQACSNKLKRVIEELLRVSSHERFNAETIMYLAFFGEFGRLPNNIL